MTLNSRSLQQAKKMEHLKSDFITVASHMFRTPISAIRWSLDMLLDGRCGKLNERQRETVLQAYQNNKLMVKVVNDLLKVARIEEKRISLYPRRTALMPLLKAAVKDAEPFARASNCVITVRGQLLTVYIDRLQLMQVIQALLDNAIRYSRKSNGRNNVEIVVQLVGAMVTCQWIDHGIGIPANEQHLVFTKFFRARNALHHQAEGLGLNLYISKRIIEASGGQLTFQSSRGKTVFTLSLPTNQTQLEAAAWQQESELTAPDKGERAIRREREFVNITIHELKAPLGVAKWSLEMLQSQRTGKLNVDQLELIDQVYRGNERLLVLVRDLLNLAKLQEGKFSVQIKNCALAPIIADVVKGFQIEGQQRHIQVDWKAPRLPLVKADPSRIAQVLTNLVSNAVKYTPDRGSVTIQTKQMDAKQLQHLASTTPTANITHTNNPGGYLVLSVQDSGIGISAEDQKRLFTRFFRSKNVLQSKKEGTGLGLYITKTIVSLHQGDIWFASKLKVGSTFYFSLPIAQRSYGKK